MPKRPAAVDQNVFSKKAKTDAESALGKAQATLESAQAKLAEAENSLKKKSAALEAAEDAGDAVRVTRCQYEKAKAELEKAEAKIAVADAKAAVARANAALTELTKPKDKKKLLAQFNAEAEAATSDAQAARKARDRIETELQASAAATQGVQQGLSVDAKVAIEQYLDTLSFPTALSALEFPLLALPAGHPLHGSVEKAQVRALWSAKEPTPDFLTTGLEHELVTVRNLTWNSIQKRLSVDKGPTVGKIFDLSSPDRLRIVLVAPSGAGKSRLLFEQGYKEWGVYLVADTKYGAYGSADLQDFLSNLPNPPELGSIGRLDAQLRRHTWVTMLSRMLVLNRLKQRLPGLEPRHWFAAQLHPNKIFGVDVFERSIFAARDAHVDSAAVNHLWQVSGLRFLALDEAQVADSYLAGLIPSATQPDVKRSALYSLIREISPGLESHIVLAGTGLRIESSFATLYSSVALRGPVRLVGITTYLEADAVSTALKSRGIPSPPAMQVLERFTGRPRFAMTLASALMSGEDVEATARGIIKGSDGLRIKLDRLKTVPLDQSEGSEQSSENVYQDLRTAGLRWILKGERSVLRRGEAALEAGVCTLNVQSTSFLDVFDVREPLVLDALIQNPTAEFSVLGKLSDSEIGLRFEEFIGWSASSLLGALPFADFPDFVGPWSLRQHGADQRRGLAVKDGEEPGQITRLLNFEEESGLSLIFPGTAMGPDIVLVARHSLVPNRRLLCFVQVKACMNASTPAALRTLEFPYFVNREKETRAAATGMADAASALNLILNNDNVALVHVVVKFPANSAAGMERVKQLSLNVGGKPKPVLQVVIDRSNAKQLLPDMYSAMQRMEAVKQTDVLYRDDE